MPTLTLKVTVQGENVELDVPVQTVHRLQILANERGMTAQALAGELLERAKDGESQA